jgi:hypothetical protein
MGLNLASSLFLLLCHPQYPSVAYAVQFDFQKQNTGFDCGLETPAHPPASYPCSLLLA